MLQEEMNRTTDLLESNRALVDRVANALIERNRLTRKDLMEILPATPGEHGRPARKES
jgi:ATP-dependent Zn protease